MKKIICLLLALGVILFTFSCKSTNPSIKIVTTENILSSENPIDFAVELTNTSSTYTLSYSDDTLVKVQNNKLMVIGETLEDAVVSVKAYLDSDNTIFDEKEFVVKSTVYGLKAPTNVEVSPEGLVTWDLNPKATSYIVKINSNKKTVTTNEYQVGSIYNDFTVSVASVNEYKTSEFSSVISFKAKNPYENVTVGIKGSSEVKSGKTTTLSAIVSNAGSETGVSWSIVEGAEYATISEDGTITASEVSGDKIIRVAAKSIANPEKVAEKVLTVVSKPVLTDEMLSKLSDEKIGFEGYVNISLYTLALFSKLHSTYVIVVKTSMDGSSWYAEYENSATGLTQGLYIKDHDNLACNVGVSFLNVESYEPMEDDDGSQITWENSGLYNNFIGLKASDFTFNTDTWRYEYTGSDATLAEKMVASANPYDFKADGFSLIVEDDEILGIYAKSLDDYGIVTGYRAVQELTVAVNYGDTVVVPEITKYTHDDRHDILNSAISKMQNLDSYTLNFKEISSSYYTSGYTFGGYIEQITSSDCLFTPYTIKYSSSGDEIVTTEPDEIYGYHKVNDNLYNSFSNLEQEDKTYKLQATRAYNSSFKNAMPSFAFAAEIFNRVYYDETEESYTFYVDSLMTSVASTFYYGVGNDINLYGIFGAEGTVNGETFTPYVTVNKDGYIVEAGFYFNISYIYGLITITYSDFNATTIDQNITFETRKVPTSWKELTIEVSNDSSQTSDDVETNALEYLKEFYGDEQIEEKMPFFGTPLGDTYGFGLSTVYVDSTNKSRKAIVFYYDVPLDIDYSIDSSLKAVEKYLTELGFSKNSSGEFEKDGIVVAPVDSSLDLLIYVWKVN